GGEGRVGGLSVAAAVPVAAVTPPDRAPSVCAAAGHHGAVNHAAAPRLPRMRLRMHLVLARTTVRTGRLAGPSAFAVPPAPSPGAPGPRLAARVCSVRLPWPPRGHVRAVPPPRDRGQRHGGYGLRWWYWSWCCLFGAVLMVAGRHSGRGRH